MAANVEISKASNGTTKVIVNGIDVSEYITHFSLELNGGECFPTLSLTIPASAIEMAPNFWADVEIKKIPNV